MAVFLRGLLEGTSDGRVAWTGQEDGSLAAELGDGYSVTLRLEAEGFKDDRSPGPDHVLSLSHRGRIVLPIDRRSVNAGALKQQVEHMYDARSLRPFPYSFFVDLWKAAANNAFQATGHLRAVAALIKRP
jgi:hypothetical protein